MENNFTVKQIGVICTDENGFRIELAPKYRKALIGLDNFSYINIIWWFDCCDNKTDRSVLSEAKPYTKGPDTLGTFATRSPQRPNPIALSCAYVTYIDADNGVVGLAYIDADDQSPVLDIKPYTPSLDRVEEAGGPAWCRHWPNNVETSGNFDWESEFNF
ncbi:MAG: SAM-dependent methyltransferase [Clostridia bacterium]|nr:SAM-dependent methyltransferase [Clostridia bacterium]